MKVSIIGVSRASEEITNTFMPTGGVSAANLKDYLAVPAVVACGGSWLTPKKEIDAGNFAAITALAREAVEIAKEVRGPASA